MSNSGPKMFVKSFAPRYPASIWSKAWNVVWVVVTMVTLSYCLHELNSSY